MDQSGQPIRTKILDFIAGSIGSQFVIPVYQRNYTWNANTEVKKFLDDLIEIVNDKYRNHFIGIIMYLPKNINYKFREYSVIDGQQRLTTIFLILYAIRDLAKFDREDIIENHIDEYIYNRNIDERYKMKLKPLISDDDVYKKIADSNFEMITDKDKQTTVYKNYEYIKRYLEKAKNIYGYDKLLDALYKFNVVIIPLNESDNAQQVFESINASGIPLTSVDLIRNFILMDMDSNEQDRVYNMFWKEIEKIFWNGKKSEDFFRYYLASKNYYLSSKSDIYKDFKEYWKQNSKETDVKLKDILNNARNFSYLYLETGKVIREIQEFRNLDSFTSAPFVIGIYDLFKNDKIEENVFLKIIDLITIYMMRRELAGLEINVISRFFPTLLKKVQSECDGNYEKIYDITVKYLVNYNKNNKSNMPEDIQIKNHLSTANAYAKPNLKLILEKIENYNNRAPVDFENLSKEHIMPQEPNDYWKEIVKEKINDYEYYVNLLGNMTLVSSLDNSGMKNKNFEEKKKYLSDTSHIKLNEEILKESEWNIAKIELRTKELIRKINIVYPYIQSKLSEDSKYYILLNKYGIEASGCINTNGTVEINAGSEIKYKTGNIASKDPLFVILYDNGIIIEEEGKLLFNQDYKFDNLDDATRIILGTSGDSKRYWTDSYGDLLSSGGYNLVRVK